MTQPPLGRGTWDWPFSFSDLTAGLRKHFDDATLAVDDVQHTTLPFQRPGIGRVRGLGVKYRTRKGGGRSLWSSRSRSGRRESAWPGSAGARWVSTVTWRRNFP
jgi:hypothetical protein